MNRPQPNILRVPSGLRKESRQGLGDREGLALLTGVILAFFSPLLLMGKIFFYFDFTYFTYPTRFFLNKTFLEGSLPFWNPHIFNGEPLLAAFGAGVFYPPSLLLFCPDFILGLNLFYIFHFLLLGTFVFLLVRRWGLSVEAALGAGFTAVFSGFFLSSVLLNNYFLANCWFPAFLYFLDRGWQEGRPQWFAAAVGVLTCQTLAGSPSSCMLTVLMGGAWVWLAPLSPQKGLMDKWRHTRRLTLITLLAIGISGIQLAPTVYFMKETQRQGGLSFKDHTQYSVEPEQILELTGSKNMSDFMARTYDQEISLNGEQEKGLFFSIYMGLLPVWLLLLTLMSWRRPHPPVRFWLLVTLAGLFLGLGKFNPIYEWIYRVVPFLDVFRYPEKYFFLTAFGLIFLTAYGIEAMVRGSSGWQVSTRKLLFGVLLLFVTILLIAAWRPQGNYTLPLSMIALLAVVVVIVRFGNLSAPACRRCFVMIILLDLCVQNWHLPPMVDREFFERPPVLLNEIPIGKEPFRIYSGLLENEPRSISLPGIPNRYVEQLMTVELLKPYFGLVYGLEYSEGVPGMALGLESVVLTWKMFKKASPAKRRRMLERSNVGFWVDLDKPFPRSMDGVPIILPGRVKRLDDALPRAFLVNRARVEKPVSLLNTYLDAHFDPLKEVLIEEPVALSPHPDFVGEVEELTYTPNHVRLRTRQNGDAMLVLLDSFFPGWEVTVDGAPEKIHRANHFFRAVRLPPGDHLIEFQYVPAGFQLGIGITLASLAAALGFLGWEIRRLRKKSLPAVEKSIISN